MQLLAGEPHAVAALNAFEGFSSGRAIGLSVRLESGERVTLSASASRNAYAQTRSTVTYLWRDGGLELIQELFRYSGRSYWHRQPGRTEG